VRHSNEVTRVDVIGGTACSSINLVRFKNISLVDLHCLTDRTSEVYSPVKPLKDGETIIGLTVAYRKPILPHFFYDLFNSLKTRFN
jgi:hypothetical protein